MSKNNRNGNGNAPTSPSSSSTAATVASSSAFASGSASVSEHSMEIFECFKVLEEFERKRMEKGLNYDEFVESLLSKVKLDSALSCLSMAVESGDQERIKSISKTIEIIFLTDKGLEQVDKRFEKFFVIGLQHPDTSIRLLSLSRLYDYMFPSTLSISNDSKSKIKNREWVLSSKEILTIVANYIREPDTSVAMNASKFLFGCASILVKSNNSLDLLLDVLNKSYQRSLAPATAAYSSSENFGGDMSEIHMRFYELFAQISSLSDTSFELIHKLKLLDPIIGLINTDDILMQMNGLYLLDFVSKTQKGFDVLMSLNAIPILVQLAGIQDNNADPILGEESMRVVCSMIARWNPVSISEKESVQDAIINEMTKRLDVNGGGNDKKIAAADILGNFAASNPPYSLEYLITKHKPAVKALIAFSRKTGEEPKVSGFLSLAKILSGGSMIEFHIPSEYDMKNWKGRMVHEEAKRVISTSLLEQMFEEYAGISYVDYLIESYSTAPFETVRSSALSCLRMLAGQDDGWGVRMIFSSSKTQEQLFDRDLELISKQVKEWRFSVVQAIAANPHSRDVLGDLRMESILKFLKSGPFVGGDNSVSKMTMHVEDEAL